MKVKFLRDHLSFKAGDHFEADQERANYWIRTGTAEAVKSKRKPAKKSVKKK